MKEKSRTLHKWTDINSLLRTHKLIHWGLIFILLIQTVIIGVLLFSGPVVVFKEGQQEQYFKGKRAQLPMSEQVVGNFVKDFLKIRYQWKELNPEGKKKSLAPFVTDGFNKKLFQLLTHLKEKEFEGKKTSQVIVNLEVEITKKKVLARFDKVLRIAGIPIVVPSTLSLNVIRGTPNRWNPTGLLVNGVIEEGSRP